MSKFSFSSAVATLQELRKTGERKSDLVVSLGEIIIESVWSVYEQIFIAALDLKNDKLAKICLDNLEKRFANSPRVKILEGMKLEAEGKLDDASTIYKNILEADESNVAQGFLALDRAAGKRVIATFKAKGQISEAIEALSKYLDVYCNDTEAWLELSALYLEQHLYQQARFCLEEVILLQPQNHLSHLKYAEILYTSDNIPLALREYCRVVELCDDYLRALYGIKLCTEHLLSLENTSSSSSKSQVSTSLYDAKILSELKLLATERILNTYSRKSRDTATDKSNEFKKYIVEWLQAA
ncbi:10659_t:CDS:2 [Ambispora gerdemannii]|uniref:ER membrane protein complex subunit 2 n=1 Tax=Ambispora gerdemannii TaxID=144530 RepID=A0A9N8YJT7_9GLOM|nr:10659_t:CDS:2 [Ambispora gerdemannii]